MAHLPVKRELARGRREAEAPETLLDNARAPTTLGLEQQRRFSQLRTVSSHFLPPAAGL